MLLLGPPAGLLVNVFIYAPLFLWLWKVPYDGHRRHAPGAGQRSGGLSDMLAMLRQVSGNRTIFSMILLSAVSSLFVGNAFQAQMPEYAHDLGTDDAGVRYSILLGANAAGALIGGLVLESRGLLQARPQTAIVFALVWCVVIAGFAAATIYPLAVALMFVAGFLNLAYSSMSQTLVQIHAPAQLRGRLIGLYNTANNGMRAFSGVTVGIAGSLIGIHWSLALSAMALLAATLGLWAFAARAVR
jgi:MFS family permease